MRKFSSYGPVDVDSEFYVPRKQLIAQACEYLTGIDWNKGGNYFTVWGPRQVGKSWVMQQARGLRQRLNCCVIQLDFCYLTLVPLSRYQ